MWYGLQQNNIYCCPPSGKHTLYTTPCEFDVVRCYQITYYYGNVSRLQVHKARLADGREVAVKIQYPGLRGAANADLTTLSFLSSCASVVFPEFRLSWLYTELRHKLEEELGEFRVQVLVEVQRPD